MRKFIVMICIILLLIIGYITYSIVNNDDKLASNEVQIEMEKRVHSFYQASYEYVHTVLKEDQEGNELSKVTLTGTLENSPYNEKISVDFDNTSTVNLIYNEVHYMENNGKLLAEFLIDGKWQNQKINSRIRPYGYDKDITFTYISNENINGKELYKYSGEYIIDINSQFNIAEKIIAKVYQEYYVDRVTNTIIKINTDLTDLNTKVEIANDIAINGLSMEDSLKKLRNSESEIDVLLVTKFQ